MRKWAYIIGLNVSIRLPLTLFKNPGCCPKYCKITNFLSLTNASQSLQKHYIICRSCYYFGNLLTTFCLKWKLAEGTRKYLNSYWKLLQKVLTLRSLWKACLHIMYLKKRPRHIYVIFNEVIRPIAKYACKYYIYQWPGSIRLL